MTTTIRADTDQIRAVANQMRTTAEQITGGRAGMQQSIDALDATWSGRARDRGMARWAEIAPWYRPSADGLIQMANGLEALAQRLDDAAAVFGEGEGSDGLTPQQALDQQWAEWSVDQKFEFLHRQYQKLLEGYNMKKVPLEIIDLPDDNGLDSRGVFNGEKIVIDIDNVKDESAESILETLLHEGRHQIQHEMVRRYESQWYKHFLGQKIDLPPGINEDQVKAWQENFKSNNYKKPEDDFQAYRNQPVEADARDFAAQRVNEFIEEYTPPENINADP